MIDNKHSYEELIDLVDSATETDKKLIRKAYDFAKKAHEGQLRKSGEPYFNHAYETAKTLAELKMYPVTICAGLLHDVVEDTSATEEDIKKEFGDEILFLVEGVTKLGKVRYHGAERYIESLRKFLVAIAQDIRVLIIKLADRLHNMNTLDYLPKEKQKRIAYETLEIYAPLAYRLSIRKLSRDLEDLSFKYIDPAGYEKTVAIIKSKKEETLPRLEKFLKSVKKALAEEGLRNFSTDYRQKGIFSLFKKLETKDNDPEKIYDILALRIVVDEVSDCYKVLGIIHSKWKPLVGRIKDYIANPKPNGYKSLHTTVLTGDGAIVEIQIRTKDMHYISEYGIASHVSYKANGSKNSKENNDALWFKQFLPKAINFAHIGEKKIGEGVPKWIKDLADVHLKDKKFDPKKDFMEDLRADFFSQRIFVLTPKSDVVDLPIGSTPIDFAFSIHSDLGRHTSGARINGKMVSIDTSLHNGDVIEIIKKESAKPTNKWLDFAKTTIAKKHINNYLEKQKAKTRI